MAGYRIPSVIEALSTCLHLRPIVMNYKEITSLK